MRFILLSLLTTLALSASDKIALLIGNSNYSHLQSLSSPSQDIPTLAQKLRGIGFDVTPLYDLDEKAMKKAINTFKQKLYANPNAIALFYYSGHGSQAYGDSYLIPIDGNTQDQGDVEADGVKVENIAQKMANANTKVNILFLDACRDVPTGTMGGTKGLGQVKRQPSSTLILYSTSKNRTAKDDRIFNQTVLSKISSNMELASLANRISYSVSQKTAGSQVPEILSTGLPMVCLSGRCVEQVQEPKPQVRVVEKIVYVEKPHKLKIERISSSKWLTPTNNTCTANGGKLYKGVCQATWKDATKICSASGARLPTRRELRKVITDCGGEMKDDNSAEYKRNRNNSSYQSCYKQKGFSNNDWYWTSTNHEKNSSNAWLVSFSLGLDDWNGKALHSCALCVR